MATIGYVTKREDGRYEGELKTLSVRASIAILPVGDKLSDNQPDFRVMSQGIEIGAGWQRIGQTSGKEYISLSISAPELGRTLYANLGRAAGRSDPNVIPTSRAGTSTESARPSEPVSTWLSTTSRSAAAFTESASSMDSIAPTSPPCSMKVPGLSVRRRSCI